MKRGVMITLGMVVLASVILSLGVLIFHNTFSLNDRFGELALYDRLYELDSSVSNGMKNIFDYHSGISIYVGNGVADFGETIPSDTNFGSVMDDYKSYIESSYNSSPYVYFDTYIFNLVRNTLPIYVHPPGISYSHDVFDSSNSISITSPDSVTVHNYTFVLNTSADSVSLYWYTSPSPSGKPVTVTVNYDGGSVSQSNTILMSGTIAVNMTYDGSPDGAMFLLSPQTMTFYRGVNTVGLESLLAFDGSAELPYASYPAGLYNILYQESNLSKSSTARIV